MPDTISIKTPADIEGMRVAGVDAWHRYLLDEGITITKGPRDVPDLKIRAFVFNDPEGYQIEIQSVLT